MAKLEAIGVRGQDVSLQVHCKELWLMGSTLHGCQCNQVCPKGLFLALYYLCYSVIHHSTHGMFADDLSICKDVSTWQQLTLPSCNRILIVSRRWQFQLNCCKCEALNVSNKWSPLLYTYIISNQLLQWSPQCHYLGVLIDSHLWWGVRCSSVALRNFCILNLLWQSFIWLHKEC